MRTVAAVVRRITHDQVEYFRVARRGVQRLVTVRRTRANGQLARQNHRQLRFPVARQIEASHDTPTGAANT